MMIVMTITTMMAMMGALPLNEHFPRRAGGGSKTRWQAPLVDIRVGAAAGSYDGVGGGFGGLGMGEGGGHD